MNRKRSVVALLKLGVKLHLDHFFSLRSFRSLRNLEFDFLSLFKGLETITLNCAVVNEDVRRARLLDETIALGIVEPLDLTGYSRHSERILLMIR